MRGELIKRDAGSGLVDVLDRVLDKGLVIAGDVRVSLAEVELLTIRIRLIVCSVDKAMEIGLDWWRYDQHLAPAKNALAVENQELKAQVAALERRVAQLAGASAPGKRAIAARRGRSTRKVDKKR